MNHTTCMTSAEVNPFLEGSLSAQRTSELEDHLATCPCCFEILQSSAGDPLWWQDMERALTPDSEAAPFLFDNAANHAALLALLGPTDDPDMLGRIGPYEVLGVLGQGGMGGVFKAHDPGLNRFVAIKVLLPHLAASGAARTRFRREGQAAAAVIHDNVLPVYAVDEYRGTPYLVMQYIRGMTLQQRLAEQGPLATEEILRIGLHAARGLSAAHSLGLIHRDIKPSNILIDGRASRAILSDFGLARAIDDASLTHSGTIAGTPLYMSPEQIQGDSLDARSDLFSLGSVLYTMSTGHPPFRAESSYAVIQRIVHDAPRSIRDVAPQIPQWLEKLIFQLMEKNPAKRPQTAQDVADLLQTCLAHIEQPQLVSLPVELQDPKVTQLQRKMRHIMFASALLSLTGGLLGFGIPYILSPLPTDSPNTPTVAPAVAGISTDENDQNSETTAARTRKLKGSTTVQGNKVELIGIGLVEGMPGVTRFRPETKQGQWTTQQFGDNNNNQFGQFQNFDNGNGTGGGVGGFGSTSAGGGGFAAAGGGGSTAGGAFVLPNQGIALKITPAKSNAKKNNSQIVELGSAVKIVEKDGTTQQAEDMGPITHSWPEFERIFPGTKCLFLSRRQPITESFQELQAELHITPGRMLTALFSGDRPQKKKVQGEEFSIQSVQTSPQGVQIVASFPLTLRVKKATNLQERMMAMMTSTDAYELEFEDSMGKIYVATGKSGTGSGGGSFQSFSFNGNTQQRSSQSPEASLSTINFRFPPLASNNTIKTITAILRDVEGETEKVPFTIRVE